MNYQKRIILLANSRKNSQLCIAGKTIESNGRGEWIRPVSCLETGELTKYNIQYQNGEVPKVLDIALIEFTRPQPKPYQPENNLIDDTKYWMQQGTFSKKSLDRLLDHPETIWLNSSDSAYMGINERIHKDKLEAVDSSLMFIRPEDVTMIVTHEYARKRVRANFLYNDVRYQLCVTDQTYENQYTCEGTYRLSGKVYFCISLGVLFNNYCYKLVAGIITE